MHVALNATLVELAESMGPGPMTWDKLLDLSVDFSAYNRCQAYHVARLPPVPGTRAPNSPVFSVTTLIPRHGRDYL
jgi:hypothetical protein